MLFSSATFWTALIFLVSIAACEGFLDKRDSAVFIGYRTVNPDLYQKYVAAGNTLVYDTDKNPSSDQLGPGAYLTPGIGQWDTPASYYYCAILVEPTAWNLVNKAWVPETDGCNMLWWGENKGEPNRPAYLEDLGGLTCTTSNTVLFSLVDDMTYIVQLLIPKDLLGSQGGLGITTQCYSKQDTDGIAMISAYGEADWYSWPNIKGTPQMRTPKP